MPKFGTIMAQHWRAVVTIVFGIGVFLFWFVASPQWLSYWEQMQLFRWESSYFINDISISGGLADYLGEFIVQFYYVEWLGALLLALLFIAIQRVTYIVLADFLPTKARTIWLYVVSFSIAILMWLLLGDINVMLSFPIACALSLLAVWLMNRWQRRWHYAVWFDLLIAPAIFWLFGGGASWLYVVVRLLYLVKSQRQFVYTASLLYLLAIQAIAAQTVLTQWPKKSVFVGLNYYFIPMQYVGQHIGFDPILRKVLMSDYLVRHERWSEIIARSEERHVRDNFTLNCINLALSQERQLAERMFDFYQVDEGSLLMSRVRDCMSNYPTMEAFWRLGLVNSCLRYASDLQESIYNGRKSGRLVKRIAECHIVNGNYDLARKNLGLLKLSTFYRSWAIETEKLLEDESRVASHPIYGRLRSFRLIDKIYFSYPEKEKILGRLFIKNQNNKMALDYFLGDLLLKGDFKSFARYSTWVQQYGGYQKVPRGYMDAAQFIQSQGNVKFSPYAEYAKRMMKKWKKNEKQ